MSAAINAQDPGSKTVRLPTLGKHLTRVATAARVLVVDDDALFLQVVCGMLRREGYDVFAAVSAQKALEIVKSVGPVDVVVSDILMPGMSGTELVRELAELSPRTSSLLMTAAPLSEVAIPPDGIPVLRKPFSKQDLICAVEAALARSHSDPP